MPIRNIFQLKLSFENNLEIRMVMKDEYRRSYIGYLPNIFTSKTLYFWWKISYNAIKWKKPKNINSIQLFRSAAFFVNKNCRCNYKYSGLQWSGKEFPEWFLRITKIVMTNFNIEKLPNSCNINLYKNGMEGVGWHSDNEPIFQSKYRDCIIISLSLGAKRKFQFKKQWNNNEPVSINLKSGDIFTMEGLFQRFYSHRILQQPYIQKNRINFTWRWIILHSKTEQCPFYGVINEIPGHYFSYLKNNPIL